MDRNELVEKAATVLEARSENDDYEWCLGDAAAVLDAILPDVIEVVREEAAQIAADWEPECGWNRSTAEPDEWEHETWQHNQELAAAIRAAVLGDALKSEK